MSPLSLQSSELMGSPHLPSLALLCIHSCLSSPSQEGPKVSDTRVSGWGSRWGGMRRSGDRSRGVRPRERGTELVAVAARAAVGSRECPLLWRGSGSLPREPHPGGGPGAQRAGGAAADTGVPVPMATAPRARAPSLAPARRSEGQRATAAEPGRLSAAREPHHRCRAHSGC